MKPGHRFSLVHWACLPPAAGKCCSVTWAPPKAWGLVALQERLFFNVCKLSCAVVLHWTLSSSEIFYLAWFCVCACVGWSMAEEGLGGINDWVFFQRVMEMRMVERWRDLMWDHSVLLRFMAPGSFSCNLWKKSRTRISPDHISFTNYKLSLCSDPRH